MQKFETADLRFCDGCGTTSSLSDGYYKWRRTENPEKFRLECKICAAKRRRRHSSKPEYKAASRIRQLKYLYDLSDEDWNLLYNWQLGCCAICSDPLGEKAQTDHIHGTKTVRGLLCVMCNTFLGKLEKKYLRLMKNVLAYIGGDNPGNCCLYNQLDN